MCGIKVEGENKWKTIVENATVQKQVKQDEGM
jgi:hypothetical protein